MKVTITGMVLAALLVFSLPVTASAESWYRVDNPGSHVDVHQRPYKRGRVVCRIPHGEVLYRPSDSSHDEYAWVEWKKKFGVMEWHWKDAHRRWCPHWDRSGFVDTNLLRKINKPGGWWLT